jgi:predicted ATPase
MPRVIISGGPGAGKTSLLHQLSLLGFRTVQESARAIIAERLAAGASPRPDPATFALEILQRDIEKYEREANGSDWVFFDHGIPEALGMVRETGAMSPERIAQLLQQYIFHPKVFVLPPWEAIYRQDAERDQTYPEAVAVHAVVVRFYLSLGYEVHEVPKASVEERAKHILSAAAASAA